MVSASCLCGKVAWEVDGDLQFMSHCHCGICRKVHGSMFATYALAKPEDFRWLRGADETARYESSPGFFRPFCPACGSVVPEGPGEEGYVGGFIEHYIMPVLYPDGLTREIQIVLGIIVVALNLVVYTLIIRRARKSL